MHEFFSLFFLPVWNWEGDVVVYERGGDRYVQLTDAELREYTGRVAEDFDAPFFHRFPVGLLALVLLIGGVVFNTWRKMRALG